VTTFATRSPSRRRGFTLIEVLVAIAILAFIASLLFTAFSGLKRSKEGVERVNDRIREGRLAMAYMVRELQSAYLSLHEPIAPVEAVEKTAFLGHPGTPGARVDFVSFAHRRLDRDAHESDQEEVSYFMAPDPEHQEIFDLVRRESSHIDLEPDRGGRINVLATDVDLFDVKFLDPITGIWQDKWDTTQATEQAGRLPLQVRILLVLNGGTRQAVGRGRRPIRLVTKVMLPIGQPLTFATQGG